MRNQTVAHCKSDNQARQWRGDEDPGYMIGVVAAFSDQRADERTAAAPK